MIEFICGHVVAKQIKFYVAKDMTVTRLTMRNMWP